jgi:hypothetical protein
MQFKIPFQGSRADGVTRIKQMLAEHAIQIKEHAQDVKTEWHDNVLSFEFTAQGKHIVGTVTVNDNEFDIYAKLPLTLRLFEGTIERMVEAEIKKLAL